MRKFSFWPHCCFWTWKNHSQLSLDFYSVSLLKILMPTQWTNLNRIWEYCPSVKVSSPYWGLWVSHQFCGCHPDCWALEFIAEWQKRYDRVEEGILLFVVMQVDIPLFGKVLLGFLLDLNLYFRQPVVKSIFLAIKADLVFPLQFFLLRFEQIFPFLDGYIRFIIKAKPDVFYFESLFILSQISIQPGTHLLLCFYPLVTVQEHC